MKAALASFLKPRPWTVLFAFLLVGWQYLYGYRGIDLGFLKDLRVYFGFGVSFINWNDFLIRSFSLAVIWIIVAVIIFLLLWLFESIAVSNHNRKISKQYLNQPKEDYAHLLKETDSGKVKHLVSYLWLSGFLILIPIGFLLISGLVETIRINLVFSYITTAQESGSGMDYNSIPIIVTSFITVLPFWYLFACFDSWCLIKSNKVASDAKLLDEHYAVPIIEEAPEDDDSEDENDSNLPISPVI